MPRVQISGAFIAYLLGFVSLTCIAIFLWPIIRNPLHAYPTYPGAQDISRVEAGSCTFLKQTVPVSSSLTLHGYYRAEMLNRGWTLNSESDLSNEARLRFSRNDYFAEVSIASSDTLSSEVGIFIQSDHIWDECMRREGLS